VNDNGTDVAIKATPDMAPSYRAGRPIPRASGVNHEVRRAESYSVDDGFDWEVRARCNNAWFGR